MNGSDNHFFANFLADQFKANLLTKTGKELYAIAEAMREKQLF